MKILPVVTQPFISRTKSGLKRFQLLPGSPPLQEKNSFSKHTSISSEVTQAFMLQQIALQRKMQIYAGTSGVIKGVHDTHVSALRGVKGGQ